MRQVLSISLLAASLAFSPFSTAQSVDDFDEISARMDAEFESQTKRIDDIYQAVDEAIDRAFRGLTKRIEVKWPDGALPERHRWVTYNKTMSSRAIADFESGELIIETLVEPGEDLQERVAELMEMSSSIATATPAELDEQDVLLQQVTKEVAEVTEEPVEITSSTDSSLSAVLPDTIGGQLEGLADALQRDLSAVPELQVESESVDISAVVSKVAQQQQLTKADASKPRPQPKVNNKPAKTPQIAVVPAEKQPVVV
ncbi:MAG TPA: hypothetical protein DCW59_15550, partial [Alteromonas sp.]|nr:hypothetical protein [Alteromonas sp.]